MKPGFTGNEESEQGMVPFLISKTEEVSNTKISRPCPKFPYVWTTQRSNGRKYVPF
jgi:hypothetical protein